MTGVLLDGHAVASLEEFRSRDGGKAFAAARQLDPAVVVEEISASGLRGRGGGGFPVGKKWAGIRAAGPGRRFAVCNAAEGEPGTFKDRTLLRHDPYRVLEGLAIAAYAIGAEAAYIATKASYAIEAERIARAIDELRADGLLGDLPITLVLGPDEYLFGEEKALLEVIEGNDPLPRLLPPYEHGLFATDIQTGWQAVDAPTGATGRDQPNPTLVNNVETLAHPARRCRLVPHAGHTRFAGHHRRHDRRRRAQPARHRGRARHTSRHADRPRRRSPSRPHPAGRVLGGGQRRDPHSWLRRAALL